MEKEQSWNDLFRSALNEERTNIDLAPVQAGFHKTHRNISIEKASVDHVSTGVFESPTLGHLDMTGAELVGGAIRVLSPTTEDDWRDTDLLIAELKEWDLRQSQALGFDPDEVMSVFYPDDIGDIRRDSLQPDGCFLLARDAQLAAGCAAFRRLTATACELYDVYVRPSSRGRGIGLLLLQQLIAQAKTRGYHTMCLETAKFMHDAHRLYRSLQFHVREPYRSTPVAFTQATMWMERELGE